MKKQIQFAAYRVYGTEMLDLNKKVREEIEGTFEHDWVLESWKPVGMTVDEFNNPVINIVVCVTREIEEPAVKAK